MKRNTLSAIVSISAVLLVIGHLSFPNIKLDAVTLILIVVAILPWLTPLFKSVELPGGFKVEFQEFEKVKEKAGKAGLLEVPLEKKEQPAFITIAEEDPNLALAGLRIEIEKRLRSIAERQGLDTRRAGIGQLLRQLSEVNALSQQEYSVLNDVIGLLNRAVHAIEIDPQAVKWALEVGPQLLAALDRRLR